MASEQFSCVFGLPLFPFRSDPNVTLNGRAGRCNKDCKFVIQVCHESRTIGKAPVQAGRRGGVARRNVGSKLGFGLCNFMQENPGAVGSNPARDTKIFYFLFYFFFLNFFLSVFTCIELVIPWGMFTNHVDRKRGGEDNFSSCINDLVHSALYLCYCVAHSFFTK